MGSSNSTPHYTNNRNHRRWTSTEVRENINRVFGKNDSSPVSIDTLGWDADMVGGFYDDYRTKVNVIKSRVQEGAGYDDLFSENTDTELIRRIISRTQGQPEEVLTDIMQNELDDYADEYNEDMEDYYDNSNPDVNYDDEYIMDGGRIDYLVDSLYGNTPPKKNDIMHVSALPDTPLTDRIDPNIIQKIHDIVNKDNKHSQLSVTSIAPVSDINIGTFNNADSSLALNNRIPLSVNRFL